MILVYGEILIDMNCLANSNQINYFVGGAPFNVAYSIKKYDQDVTFVGSVGNDFFGTKIKEFIDNCGIESKYTSMLDDRHTTIAMVANNEDGERTFTFLRDHTADYVFNDESLELIANADIVHIGSLMISEKEGFAFAKKAIKKAKSLKKVISFDVNFRSDIFKSMDECISRYNYILKNSNIIKVSVDELFMLTNCNNLDEALEKLAKPSQKIFITLGKDGSMLYYNHKKYFATSIDVDCVDTTGAGDAFYGTMLAQIDEYGVGKFFKNTNRIVKALKISNIQGACATRQKGALSSVIDKKELLSILNSK